jgi:glycosyltransferase involved in cell wall biosynthesis
VSERRTRVLFNVFADRGVYNAQSLNAREIARRLNPQRFTSTLFSANAPDARVQGFPNIRLIQLPPRLGSFTILNEMLSPRYDIFFYPLGDLATRGYFALAPLLQRKKRVVMPIEGTVAQLRETSAALQNLFLSLARQSDALYACSEFVAKGFEQDYSLKMSVIPVGVDTKLFYSRDRFAHTGTVKILFVGSIQPRKQVHVILDLAAAMRGTNAEFQIVGDVIGDPSYREGLVHRVETEPLDNVHFFPARQQNELAAMMREADIFVLPSRLEGLPKVTLEAAATGLPCIIFDDYASPSVVEGVTGYQVKTFEQMLARLERLIQNRALRLQLGTAATLHARQFDWDKIARQWEEALVVRH